jgi:hypothetical protein
MRSLRAFATVQRLAHGADEPRDIDLTAGILECRARARRPIAERDVDSGDERSMETMWSPLA